MANLGVHPKYSSTSAKLAESVNAYPSFVRRVLAKLSKSGLLKTTSGKSGACTLAKEPRRITLLEIYQAIDAPKVFAVHEYPERIDCTISCGIKASMEKILSKTTKAIEKSLKESTLADVIQNIEKN